MAKLIRKISVGKDYKNDAMHYAVGQEVYGGHTICDIIEEKDKFSIYIKKNKDVLEKNSKSYFDEKTYLVKEDQIYLYKRDSKWNCPKGFCFVQPLKNKDIFNQKEERPLVGIVKYTDGTVDVEDLVGFTPNSEYEFVFEGKRLYRVYSKFITIKYEYKGDEEAYNPSWA
jgi:hypothetical protein